MDRFRVLTKLKPLEIVGVLLFVFFTITTSIFIHSWESITSYLALTDSLRSAIPFIFSLMLGLTSLFGVLGSILIILLGIFLGLNIVLLIQYTLLQRSLTTQKPKISAIHSVTGLIATVLGIGCAACGSALLFGFLSIFGASGLLFLLPLHGSEVAIVGLLVLAYSNWLLLGKLNNPYICDY